MPSFQITEAPSRLEMGAPDASGVTPPAKATFLVRNMAPSAQVGRITVEPLDGARPEWFEIAGAPATSPGKIERDFVYGGNQSVEVTVRPPPNAPAGNHGFRLRVAAESDPDADFVQGPAVAFTLTAPPAAPVPKKKIPWWIFAAAAAMVVVLAGVGAFMLMRPPVPAAYVDPSVYDHMMSAEVPTDIQEPAVVVPGGGVRVEPPRNPRTPSVVPGGGVRVIPPPIRQSPQ